MFYTVYQITNTINDKIYIGVHKTKNIHDGYMGSGTLLLRSQHKHGLHNFKKDILHTFDCSEDMFSREKELVDEKFVARNDTYNIKLGGSGGFDHLKDYIGSESHMKQFNSISQLGQPKGHQRQIYLWNNDREWRERTSKNMSIAIKKVYNNGFEGGFKNKKHTNETKEKMRESSKGKSVGEKNSQYGTIWITNGIETKKIKKDDNIPNGWNRGRKIQ